MSYELKEGVERVEGTKDIYLQVSPTRNIQGANFSNGVQVYRWAVDDNTFWHPKDSYFRIRVSLTKDGITPLDLADKTALNMGFIAELFQSLAFSINGVVINRVADFVPQIDLLDKRYRHSADWLNNFGRSTALYNPDFAARQALTASDVAGVMTASALEFDWYLPMGIFHCAPLPCGDYQVSMVPQPNSVIQARAVQVPIETPQPAAAPYVFSVVDAYFMVRTTAYGEPIQAATYMLDMEQIQCQAESIQPGSGVQQKQLEAQESTKALIVALQDQRAGTDPLYSASFFKLYDDPQIRRPGGPPFVGFSPELQLSRLYIEYAGETKPQPDWVGGVGVYAGGFYDFTNQLYMESFSNAYRERMGTCGMSPESKADHVARGSFYWFNWKKQPGNFSTRVYANIQMASPAPGGVDNNRLLLFCVYSTVAQITVHGNRAVDVRVMNV